jgi:hypothetical protein
MPKVTVREFCVAMGLEQDGTDYIGAITLLKTLVKHGVAKEAGKVNASRLGRKSIVYDLPDPIVLPIPQMVSVPATIPQEPKEEPVVEEPVAEEVQEVVETVAEQEIPVAVAAQEFSYDYGDEDDD